MLEFLFLFFLHLSCNDFNFSFLLNSSPRQEHLILRPVWDWGEQFSDKDIVLFSNPMYKKPPEQSRKSMAFLPPTAIPLPGLHQTGSRMTMHVSQLATVASQLPEV